MSERQAVVAAFIMAVIIFSGTGIFILSQREERPPAAVEFCLTACLLELTAPEPKP